MLGDKLPADGRVFGPVGLPHHCQVVIGLQVVVGGELSAIPEIQLSLLILPVLLLNLLPDLATDGGSSDTHFGFDFLHDGEGDFVEGVGSALGVVPDAICKKVHQILSISS